MLDLSINITTICSLLISSGSLVLSFFAFKDKRKSKEEEDLQEKFNDLEDNVSKIKEQDIASVKEDIESLKELIYQGKTDHEVLEERVSNEIKMLDKVSSKLDEISKLL